MQRTLLQSNARRTLFVIATLATFTFVFDLSTRILASPLTGSAQIQELRPGPPIERQVAGGETHSYRVSVIAGQFLSIRLQQKGIDLLLTISSPDGKTLSEVDNNPAAGEEWAFIIVDLTGDYRVDVKAGNKTALPGKYELRLEPLREPTAQDHIRVSAEKTFQAGNRLRDQQTAESRRQAIKKYEEALPLWRESGEQHRQAFTLNELGYLNALLGDRRKAIGFYEQAIELWRSLGDSLNEAVSLQNLGLSYRRLGQMDKALELYLQALPLAKGSGDLVAEATILSNLGALYTAMGQPQQALKHLTTALQLRRQLGDKSREAFTLNDIGNNHALQGELQESLEYYNGALAAARAASNKGLEGSTFVNLATGYLRLGESQLALDYFTQALPILRAVGNRDREAYVIHGLGHVYQDLGDQKKALEHYDQARSLFKALEDRAGESFALSNAGTIFNATNEPQRALEYFNQALTLRRAISDRSGEANALVNIGFSHMLLGDLAKAFEYYNQAWELASAVGDRRTQAATLYAMARTEYKRSNFKSAQSHIEAALALIESTRERVLNQNLRTSYLASKQAYYELFIDILLRSHQVQPSAKFDVAAFAASERARARGLVEMLTEARIDVKQGIAPDLKRREKEVFNRISQIQRDLIQANVGPLRDQSRISALTEEFKKIEADRHLIESEIRRQHPRYANVNYPIPASVSAAQQLLDDKTAMLEYAIGAESSFLFAITRTHFSVFRLPDKSILAPKIRGLRESIASRPDRANVSVYLENAQALYKDLLAPASQVLANKRALIIIPDGILHYLPFEVLLQTPAGRRAEIDPGRLPYLIRNYSISYAPSASVLEGILKRPIEANVNNRLFLGYGDPIYATTGPSSHERVQSAFRSAFGDGSPWDLEQLPESRKEVQRIAGLFPPSRVTVLLGDQANEATLKGDQRLSDYRYLHFAVHALLNENKPQYTGLVLTLHQNEKQSSSNGASGPGASDLPKGAEDGLLQVYEIFDLKLNADLVVLSACESGLGKDVRGEGLVGMTQAFFYAGSSSLLVSLWKVQDKSTADLMVRFYRNLNSAKMNKAQALRQAQLEMISRPAYSHPYYWAGFVLIGRP